MSFVPSKILKILKSLITLSNPVSRMNPIPPKICIASSVTAQALSLAKTWQEIKILSIIGSNNTD